MHYAMLMQVRQGGGERETDLHAIGYRQTAVAVEIVAEGVGEVVDG